VTRVAAKIQMTKSHLNFPHLYSSAFGQGAVNAFCTIYFGQREIITPYLILSRFHMRANGSQPLSCMKIAYSK
jgi:hypothetical protein